MSERFQFETMMSDYQKVNPEFAKVKINVMYPGRNRNRTEISRKTMEEMMYSLKNIPVVGEWVEENSNFGGHGGKLEISDQGFKYIETTKPYGVVPSDTEITWETIREKNGITEREYLTCWAYLWIGRYPEIDKILNDGSNQSMELSVTKGYWNEDDYYVVEEGHFSALCILGKDSDPEKNVEPCFESAGIKRYSLDKEEFIKEFNQMISELKFSLEGSQQEEVKLVTDEIKDIEVIEEIETVEAELDETEDEIISDEVVETLEESIENFAEEDVETEKLPETTEDVVVEKILEPEEITEVFNAGDETVKQDAPENLEMKVKELETKLETISNENSELKAYKYAREKEDKLRIVDRFNTLTEDDTKGLIENIDNYLVEELELQLFALLGKKNIEFSKTENSNQDKNEHLIFALSNKNAKTDSNTPAWTEYVEQYKAKKQK